MAIRLRNIRFKRYILLVCLVSIIFLFHTEILKSKPSTPINSIEYNMFQAKYSRLDYSDAIQSDIRAIGVQRNKYKNNADKFQMKSVELNIRKSKKDYLIIEWTKVFFQPKFCDKTPAEIFNSDLEKCDLANCQYTCDQADNNLKNADALIFHLRDLEAEYELTYRKNFDAWLENTKQLPFKNVADKLANNPNQVWIFSDFKLLTLWNDESTKIDVNFNKISHLFNWTLSFKTDAEIYEGSYGFFLDVHNVNNTIYYEKKKDIYFNDFKRRKNAILWFVSNCRSTFRIKEALKLSQHYPVYIYGDCSYLKSTDSTSVQYPNLHYISSTNENCARGSKCENEKLASFKYYFAFENIDCKDYVTEKVWRSLNKNIIPILLQPSRDSYSRYMIPDESVIHFDDFKRDPKELADQLKKIDSDFDVYFNHLKWTNIYLKTIDNPKYTEPHRMCQLCKQLNTCTSSIYYTRITDFFTKNCKPII